MSRRVERLAVRVPNWVGDVVHSLPALAALRARFPSAELTVVARGEVGRLLEHHPAVDSMIRLAPARGVARFAGLMRSATELRRRRFDLGVVLTNALEGAALFALASIPERYGYATDARRWLLTTAVPCPPHVRAKHQADYYLALLEGLDIRATRRWMALAPTEEERTAATKRLREAGWRTGRRLVAICPGASNGTAKCWPPDQYLALAGRFIQEQGMTAAVLGAAAERDISRRWSEAVGPSHLINLVGHTTLREALAVLSLCHVAVSNDSGLLHVAVAAGTPAVAIFGSTDPDRTGPTGRDVTVLRHRVNCSPCELRGCPIDHRCMTGIGADRVYEAAVERVLAGRSSVRRDVTAVFVDRDGTLNRDVGYLNDPDRLELFPGVGAAVRALNEAAIPVIVVTNQSGIARGVITDEQLRAVHQRLESVLAESGATLDAIFFCPHHPDGRCACRKPSPAMTEQAAAAFGIDRTGAVVIGDKLADVQLARHIGARAILVRTGHGDRALADWPVDQPRPDCVVDDFPAAVAVLLRPGSADEVSTGARLAEHPLERAS